MSKFRKLLKVMTKDSHKTCFYCDHKFPRTFHLDQHQKLKAGEPPLKCAHCDYSDKNKCRFKLHMEQHHHQGRPFKCPEPLCNFGTTQKRYLKLHLDTVHLKQKKYECPISACAKTFGQKSTLNSHVQTHEKTPEKRFKCPSCSFKSRRQGNLNQHISNVHPEAKAEVEAESEADEQNGNGNGNRNRKVCFKCPKKGCKFHCKTKSNLTRHVQIHAEKGLQCPHPNCEYKTNQKDGLNHHMKTHLPDSEKRFQCTICDYKTQYSYVLKKHMRIHTKETPYKCKVEGCSFGGKTSGQLTMHVRAIHDKIRPFKCPFCPYDAFSMQTLTNHQQSRHPHPNLNSNSGSEDEENQEDPLKLD